MFPRIAAALFMVTSVTAHATPACVSWESTWVWSDCDAGYYGIGCECACEVDDENIYWQYTPGDLCEEWGTQSTQDTAYDSTGSVPTECVFLRADCTGYSGGGFDTGQHHEADDEEDDEEERSPGLGCATVPLPLSSGVLLVFAAGMSLRRRHRA